jgi:hypothetical protein
MSENLEGNVPENGTSENAPEGTTSEDTYKPVAIKCTFKFSAPHAENEKPVDPAVDGQQFEEPVAIGCTLYSPPAPL